MSKIEWISVGFLTNTISFFSIQLFAFGDVFYSIFQGVGAILLLTCWMWSIALSVAVVGASIVNNMRRRFNRPYPWYTKWVENMFRLRCFSFGTLIFWSLLTVIIVAQTME
jgi:hypothetical protein